MISKVFFAADHAGFELKNALLAYVRDELGYAVEDMGAFEFDPIDDYPDFMTPCARQVAETPDALGVILGGSGQGEAMVANRIPGARAALYYGGTFDIPKLAREHNDANILSLGARFLSEMEAKAAVDIFLSTAFSGDERHVRRIAKF